MFAQRVGAEHAVATSNCTTALHLAPIAAGVGAGDDVIVPSFSFIATTNCVLYTGARPVFADIDPLTGNLTAESLEAVITPRARPSSSCTRAACPPTSTRSGRSADAAGIEMIEDAACAIGATYRGSPIGAHSALVAFSFHPRKLLTTGEGGMLTVASAERASRLRRLREHGMSMSAADRHHQDRVVLRDLRRDRVQLSHDRYPSGHRPRAAVPDRRDRRAPACAGRGLPRPAG